MFIFYCGLNVCIQITVKIAHCHAGCRLCFRVTAMQGTLTSLRVMSNPGRVGRGKGFTFVRAQKYKKVEP